jgi:hypothetical protein
MMDCRRGLHSQALALEFPQIIAQAEGVWEDAVATVSESKSGEKAGGWNK